jgi:hypothetical protein
MEDTDQVPISTWLISDLWTVAMEDRELTMNSGNSVAEWEFLNASMPEISESDYYEEFGVAKGGTRIRVRPQHTGRWSWTAVLLWDPRHPRPDPHLHAKQALSWMQEQLTGQIFDSSSR